MSYTICKEILGFPDTKNLEIIEIDTLFSTMKDIDNENISFTIVNPNQLREEYSFEIPDETRDLLEIDENTELSIYNVLIVYKPLEKSTINFLAPIIVNKDNKKLAQVILDPKENPSFGIEETIESFKK